MSSSPTKDRAKSRAVGFYDTVREVELEEVEASRKRRLQPPVRNNLVGLAFSGGGIRSATFNLGVLQGLAERNFIRQVDFLSTVSGGGYIGAWLVGWIRRAGCLPVEERLRENKQPAPEADRYLEPDQVRFLRKYSMYLAPKAGLLSADLWTAATIYIRNLLLNLILLGAFGFAVLLVPDLVLLEIKDSGDPTVFLYVVLMSMGVIAAAVIGIGLSGLSDDPPHRGWKAFVLRHMGLLTSVPLFATAASAAGLMATSLHADSLNWEDFVFGGTVVYFIFWMVAAWVRRSATRGNFPKPLDRETALSLNILSTLFSGTFSGFLVYRIAKLFEQTGVINGGAAAKPWLQAALLVFAPSLLLVTLLLGCVLHIGLAGRALPDARREWASRTAAVVSLLTLAIMALFAATLYGPFVIKWLLCSAWGHGLWGKASKWLLATAWAAISSGGVVAGKSEATNGEDGKFRLLTKIAPPVFAIGSVLLLSYALDRTLATFSPPDSGQFYSAGSDRHDGSGQEVAVAAEKVLSASNLRDMAGAVRGLNQALTTNREDASSILSGHFRDLSAYLNCNLWIVLALCLLTTIILMWRVDVNEFSMHLFYRNRLVRAYLGASQTCRVPDPFTGFAKDDDILLHRLSKDFQLERAPVDVAIGTIPESGDDEVTEKMTYELPYDGPYPIFCTALNLVRGKDLAWQQRKAESFIYTPRYCGYDHFENRSDEQGKFSAAGYRPTLGFSSALGPMVGTAIAISGAAASPNMGYHSSPALGFMMAVFNVRLGWWAGNPRHPRTWRSHGPGWGLLYLLRELFPSTNDDMAYVYLSDGGHFENLGIYELVRRQCQFIIASDADADPSYCFDNLGAAIEKCRTDFGANIDIKVDALRKNKETGFSDSHYATGEIYYADGSKGCLLYLKPTIKNDEPTDVVAHKLESPQFPHDGTADQFFDESRFESYRALGQHIMRTVIADSERLIPGHDLPTRMAALLADFKRKEDQKQKPPDFAR